ncbi:hypothetical protein LSTR_LSTR013031 [Laodelphax striatellus]|uniref:Peptidase M20 dimerisation domain-containing protein n=1 Tax=Laodelphax striatellus TaxID=195883 RepID=A0A482WNB4_LAOST|nr:hypothetical protein LSTR_LSTR013031 [Laodelphax striatellus]
MPFIYTDKWKYDPFGGEKDANGNIYGRGAQDMKCVGIQYIECIRRLMRDGRKLKRTIHLSFVPDEEIGGVAGMGEFVKSDEFRELNIGCALDEGMASPGEEFVVFNGERSIWLFEYLSLGGVQNNVVPPELVVGFDCRLSVDTDHEEFENWVKDICKEAGGGTYADINVKMPPTVTTSLDETNLWWKAFTKETDAMNLKLKPQIFPGGTDSRFIRELGIPAFGFSPMNNTPVLLHDHNEFLNEKVFLKGIDIYCQIIPALANL